MDIVDSGNQWHTGPEEGIETVYRQMVDRALTRPPKAELTAFWWRNNNKVVFYVWAKNLTGEELSYAENRASLNLITYENTKVELTSRYVRSTTSMDLSRLLPGEYTEVVLETEELDGVNWDKIAGAVILDYRPDSSDSTYDTAQAAQATQIDNPFAANKKTVTILVDPADKTMPTASVKFSGIPLLHWHISENAPWLEAKAQSGPLTAASVLSVDKAALTEGWQNAQVTFSAGGADSTLPDLTQSVTVRVYYGELFTVDVPLVAK